MTLNFLNLSILSYLHITLFRDSTGDSDSPPHSPLRSWGLSVPDDISLTHWSGMSRMSGMSGMSGMESNWWFDRLTPYDSTKFDLIVDEWWKLVMYLTFDLGIKSVGLGKLIWSYLIHGVSQCCAGTAPFLAHRGLPLTIASTHWPLFAGPGTSESQSSLDFRRQNFAPVHRSIGP